MPRIEIDVDQILTAAVALEVEPGDRLLVMNGLIIGMVEQRPRVLLAEKPAARPELPAPAAPAVHESQIRSLLSKGPLTARQIAEHYRLSGNQRNQLKTTLQRLRKRGVLCPIDAEKRFPLYQLAAAEAVHSN